MSLIRVSFWCKLAISAEDSPNTFKEYPLVVRGLPFCAAGVGSWPMEVSECWSWDASTTDLGLTEWAVTWCGDAVFSSVVTANAFWDISSISVSTWNIAGPSGSLLVSVSWYNGSFHSGWLGESISVPWKKGHLTFPVDSANEALELCHNMYWASVHVKLLVFSLKQWTCEFVYVFGIFIEPLGWHIWRSVSVFAS